MIQINKFETYKHLENYLKVIAQKNDYDINFDDLPGLENIYYFLKRNTRYIEYNFSFKEWIKLVSDNNISQLKCISEFGDKIIHMKGSETYVASIAEKLDLDIIFNYGIDEVSVSVYNRPNMTTNIGCYFIYDNNEELVYIGESTTGLLERSCTSAHTKTTGDFSKIDLYEFSTKAETNLFEVYYITKFKPKLNTESSCEDNLPFDLPDTRISYKTIKKIEKKEFHCLDCAECVKYKNKMMKEKYIIFEKMNGRSFRPIVSNL